MASEMQYNYAHGILLQTIQEIIEFQVPIYNLHDKQNTGNLPGNQDLFFFEKMNGKMGLNSFNCMKELNGAVNMVCRSESWENLLLETF